MKTSTLAAVLAAAVLSGCGALSGPLDDQEFSCSDEGRARTFVIAQEVGEAIEPGYDVGDHAHGCDSTTRGVYDFVYSTRARETIVEVFGCSDEPVGFEGEGMRCRAEAGEFALYASPGEPLAIEVLP